MLYIFILFFIQIFLSGLCLKLINDYEKVIKAYLLLKELHLLKDERLKLMYENCNTRYNFYLANGITNITDENTQYLLNDLKDITTLLEHAVDKNPKIEIVDKYIGNVKNENRDI